MCVEMRPDWEEYYLNIAKAVASRSACYRAYVGCIIVKDKQIVSTGYNSPTTGRKDCYEDGFCYRDKYNIKSGTQIDLCRCVGAHAELNAIVNAAKHGVSVKDSVLYLYGHDVCCQMCQSAILNAGISLVVLENRSGEILHFIPNIDFMKHPVLDS